jgi:DNA-binding CsgD family transcriptional regulator
MANGDQRVTGRRLEPSRVGVLLLNADHYPIHYDAEAGQILSYPAKLEGSPSLDAVLPPETHAQLAKLTAGGPQFKVPFTSGRRRYRCRVLLLNSENRHRSRLQPKFIVFLERQVTQTVDITRWGQEFQLTTRERETVELLLEGLTSREIAERMGISPNTVKSFLRLVMVKVGASSRTGIIAKIYEKAS